MLDADLYYTINFIDKKLYYKIKQNIYLNGKEMQKKIANFWYFASLIAVVVGIFIFFGTKVNRQ